MSVRLRRRLFQQRRFRQLIIGLIILALWLGILIVAVEQTHPNSDFHTWFDGLYWSVTTVTTVGYGDYVPVTIVGKWISIVLQLIGALMFGLLIAIISSYVNRYQEEFYWNRMFERLDRLEDQLEKLKKGSNYLVRSNHDELQAELEAVKTQAVPAKPSSKKTPKHRFKTKKSTKQ